MNYDLTQNGKTDCKLEKDEINALPLFHYTGPVHLVRNEDECVQAISALKHEAVLGFDTETRPSFKKGKTYSPALVQIAGQNAVYIFQLKELPFGPYLAGLLSRPEICKTGVAVHDDMAALQKLHKFSPANVIDLTTVARKNKVMNFSLRGLAAFFLDIRISKGEQCSNWSATTLSQRQIRYAATDAWASRAIYMAMKEKGLDF